jgi:hypothetical protein
MKYVDGTQLSVPEAQEQAALKAPLSLDAASSLDNACLARALAMEGAARKYLEPTVLCLAASPMWRLLCDRIVASAGSEEDLRLEFLIASARLMLAGLEAVELDKD